MKKIFIAKQESDIPIEIRSKLKREGLDYYVEDNEDNRLKFENIIPSGYSSKKTKIVIDLIPKNSWGASLSNSLTSKSWAEIRKPFIEKYANRCQICGRKGVSLSSSIKDVDTHEIWRYSSTKESFKVQTLMGFIAVCSSCHLMFHLGFADSIGKRDATLERLKKLEGMNDIETKIRVSEIFDIWKERSQYDWKIDITILRKYGFDDLKFKPKVDSSVFIY